MGCAPQNTANSFAPTLPFPTTTEPLLDWGKLIDKAVDLAFGGITSTTAAVGVVGGYLFSPGSGGGNNTNDTVPPIVQPVASHANTNPFAGSVSTPVIVVDPKGNAVPVKAGERIQGSPDGSFIQVKDANKKQTGTRIDAGHNSHADPRAQAPPCPRSGCYKP